MTVIERVRAAIQDYKEVRGAQGFVVALNDDLRALLALAEAAKAWQDIPYLSSIPTLWAHPVIDLHAAIDAVFTEGKK